MCKRVMTAKQDMKVRRLLIIAAQEMIEFANNMRVRVDDYESNVPTVYSRVAIEAVMAELEKDGIVPPRAA